MPTGASCQAIQSVGLCTFPVSASISDSGVQGLFCGAAGPIKQSIQLGAATGYWKQVLKVGPVEKTVFDCPTEKYVLSGNKIDISADLKDQNDCLEKAFTSDKSSTTYTWDGKDSITAVNSKWGTVVLKRSSATSCW